MGGFEAFRRLMGLPMSYSNTLPARGALVRHLRQLLPIIIGAF